MIQIQINVNSQVVTCLSPISIIELIALENLESEGTAIARNKVIVSKSQWPATYLDDGDCVDIFTLVAGG